MTLGTLDRRSPRPGDAFRHEALMYRGEAEFLDRANPARSIPAWRDFVDANAGGGRRLRGVGEPIHPDRTPTETVECHRHEAP